MTNGREPEENEFLEEDLTQEENIAGEEDFEIDLKGDPLVVTSEIIENLKNITHRSVTLTKKYLKILVDITINHPQNHLVFYSIVEGCVIPLIDDPVVSRIEIIEESNRVLKKN